MIETLMDECVPAAHCFLPRCLRLQVKEGLSVLLITTQTGAMTPGPFLRWDLIIPKN